MSEFAEVFFIGLMILVASIIIAGEIKKLREELKRKSLETVNNGR